MFILNFRNIILKFFIIILRSRRFDVVVWYLELENGIVIFYLIFLFLDVKFEILKG